MSNETMRAAVVTAPQKWEIQEKPIPELEEGNVRIKIDACGICGSDLHFSHLGLFMPGLTPGHEMAGTVDALGPGCKGGLGEGQRVTIEPLMGCGTCRFCQAGQPNVCRGMRVAGFFLPGGFAEYVNIPEAGVFPVPQELSPQIAAMGEPVAVAVHGLQRGRFEPGQKVLVLGAGAVGLVSLLSARALGAGEVWVTARYDHQAELAKTLGAKRVLREEEAETPALDLLGRQEDFDLVIETVGGSADTLRAACAAVRPSGCVSVLGVFDKPPSVDPFGSLVKECTIAFSNCYYHPDKKNADFATAARLLDSERELLAKLATHQMPLEDVAGAFELAGNKKSGAVKVTVHP